MHLADSNYAICIVGVSRGVRFVKGGEIMSRVGEILSRGARFCQGGPP